MNLYFFLLDIFSWSAFSSRKMFHKPIRWNKLAQIILRNTLSLITGTQSSNMINRLIYVLKLSTFSQIGDQSKLILEVQNEVK